MDDEEDVAAELITATMAANATYNICRIIDERIQRLCHRHFPIIKYFQVASLWTSRHAPYHDRYVFSPLVRAMWRKTSLLLDESARSRQVIAAQHLRDVERSSSVMCGLIAGSVVDVGSTIDVLREWQPRCDEATLETFVAEGVQYWCRDRLVRHHLHSAVRFIRVHRDQFRAHMKAMPKIRPTALMELLP